MLCCYGNSTFTCDRIRFNYDIWINDRSLVRWRQTSLITWHDQSPQVTAPRWASKISNYKQMNRDSRKREVHLTKCAEEIRINCSTKLLSESQTKILENKLENSVTLTRIFRLWKHKRNRRTWERSKRSRTVVKVDRCPSSPGTSFMGTGTFMIGLDKYVDADDHFLP